MICSVRKVAYSPLVNLTNDSDEPSDFLMARNFLTCWIAVRYVKKNLALVRRKHWVNGKSGN